MIIGRVAAALLGAAVPWTQIDVCPAPTDLLPADSLLVLHEGHGGLDHEHLRRAARYLDSAELPMPHVAALFIADPVDLLIMATREDDPGLVAAVQAVLTAERHRPVRDEGARRYPAHSQAKEGDRLDPFAAVWQPVVRRRRGRQGA